MAEVIFQCPTCNACAEARSYDMDNVELYEALRAELVDAGCGLDAREILTFVTKVMSFIRHTFMYLTSKKIKDLPFLLPTSLTIVSFYSRASLAVYSTRSVSGL